MFRILQIHPTLFCNRKCTFCSYRGAFAGLTLEFDFLSDQIEKAAKLGYDTIKVSGGGEPLLYDRIISVLCLAKYLNMRVSLQTNGDGLFYVHRKFCDDIRLSLSDDRKIAEPVNLTLYQAIEMSDSFSYVVTASPDYDNLKRAVRYALALEKPIRILQDETDIEHVPEIVDIKAELPENDLITFWDAKDYHHGFTDCPQCKTAPLLGADGYYYPCCRSQYAKGKNLLTYDKSMRLGQDIEEVISYNGAECVRCYCQLPHA